VTHSDRYCGMEGGLAFSLAPCYASKLGEESPHKTRVSKFQLHRSLNWGNCETAGTAGPDSTRDRFRTAEKKKYSVQTKLQTGAGCKCFSLLASDPLYSTQLHARMYVQQNSMFCTVQMYQVY